MSDLELGLVRSAGQSLLDLSFIRTLKQALDRDIYQGKAANTIDNPQTQKMKYTSNALPTLADVEFIYCPVLVVIGVSVNLLAIVILSRRNCGLSRCMTCYLVAMAVADFLVVISDVLLRWLMMYFPVSFLDITYVCCLIMVLIPATTMNSIWLTVAFTFDRFVAICCQKLKIKYCTEKTAVLIITTVSVLSYLESIPWYFKFQSKYIFNNLPWVCDIKSEYYTSIFWTLYGIFHRTLSPTLPFVIILVLNTLTVRYVLLASKSRRRLQKEGEGEKNSDPEMVKRRKSIILLFAISGSFIILWFPYCMCFLYERIALLHDYSPLSPIAGTIGYLLQLLSTCTNTCLYTVTQTQFREQLKAVVKFPFTLVLSSIKQ
ncbi:probable G-protein coupled receptor 139 [Stegostoma tigrinum]|uniref:probable G-protein coupled receptor 139 n=1 Tax=Stegostoma tigrinum TaxID=3053191 RepID=UPI00286FFD3B|nr:probable G-protein coupled receptor 139 [Stegostoma tigrinum]